MLTPTFLPASATKGSYPGKNGLIAFSGMDPTGSDSEIFTMNGDGTGAKQLTFNDVHDLDPCWSPDGEWVAFVSQMPPTMSIWVIRSDGTGLRQVTQPPVGGSMDMNPAWSPNGKKIIFTRENLLFFPYTYDIYGIDAWSTGPGELLIENAIQPSWSPDGSMIVYLNVTDSCIWVADSTTGAPLFRVTSSIGENPCWSPDGQRIVFSRGNDIFVVDVDGSNEQQITNGPSDREPNWSPDGEKILFHRTPASIWIMNPDGSEAYDLTPSMPEAMYPDWQTLQEPPIGGELFPDPLANTVTWIVAGISTIALSAVIVLKKKKLN